MTTGAENDIKQATELARAMVTRFGMSQAVGLLSLSGTEEGNFLEQGLIGGNSRPYGEGTADAIDHATRQIIDECYAKARELLTQNRHRKKALARIHERIRFRREDFAHQISRRLIDRFQILAFEDLEPQQMGRSRGMRKSIADAAWTQLIEYTSNKAEEAGRMVVLVNPCNTSKMCSHCGKKVEKDLSVRVHDCPDCGLVLDRDHNAAISILRQGLGHLRL